MRENRKPALILIALLFAAALIARAALPVGWMPTQTESGIRVMLCSGKGAIELPVQSDGKNKEQTPRDPCPYGTALAKVADLPPPLALAAMPHVVPPEVTPQAITARLVAARSIRPPARGPPAIA
ncbi:MAG: hypothetical protein KDE32_09145 [Novosphingobium sp.]|nr:hypothetical protein [Novosphingobium sp.]